MENKNGDYVRLADDVENGKGLNTSFKKIQFVWIKDRSCLIWWLKWVCLGMLAVAAVLVVIYAGPVLVRKVVIPVMDWESSKFSRPTLAFILFISLAVFPSLILPSAPSMWLAGVTFGYAYGFALIMSGIIIGMSLPFFIGSLFLRCKIHNLLEKCPDKAKIIRLAGEGDWFYQFRAVALIRVSPFPYLLFNYAAVATNVNYCPYICGSIAGTIHEIFLTIYSGKLLWTLADATNKGGIQSMQQFIFDAIGLCATIAATIIITIYSKRSLRELQDHDHHSVVAIDQD